MSAVTRTSSARAGTEKLGRRSARRRRARRAAPSNRARIRWRPPARRSARRPRRRPGVDERVSVATSSVHFLVREDRAALALPGPRESRPAAPPQPRGIHRGIDGGDAPARSRCRASCAAPPRRAGAAAHASAGQSVHPRLTSARRVGRLAEQLLRRRPGAPSRRASPRPGRRRGQRARTPYGTTRGTRPPRLPPRQRRRHPPDHGYGRRLGRGDPLVDLRVSPGGHEGPREAARQQGVRISSRRGMGYYSRYTRRSGSINSVRSRLNGTDLTAGPRGPYCGRTMRRRPRPFPNKHQT